MADDKQLKPRTASPDSTAHSEKIKMNTHIFMQVWAPFLSVSVNSPFNPCRLP